MKYTIQPVLCGAYQENAYLLCGEGRSDALLIDPGDSLGKLKDAIAASGRRLGAILLTHGHWDHMLCAQPLSLLTGAPVYVHEKDEKLLRDPELAVYPEEFSEQKFPSDLEAEALGETISVCGIEFRVLSTPGHTEGSVCFYDEENGILFSGDTLFCAGYGRMDLPGGSPMQMRDSLRMLFGLDENTHVFTGHGSDTTIGDEIARYGL